MDSENVSAFAAYQSSSTKFVEHTGVKKNQERLFNNKKTLQGTKEVNVQKSKRKAKADEAKAKKRAKKLSEAQNTPFYEPTKNDHGPITRTPTAAPTPNNSNQNAHFNGNGEANTGFASHAKSKVTEIEATAKANGQTVATTRTIHVVKAAAAPMATSSNSVLHSSVQQRHDEGSIAIGKSVFAFILNPIEHKNFMADHWESASLCIQRQEKDYYRKLNVSTATIDAMLRQNVVEYTKNIDVTSYKDGVRETLNPDGRALPDTVWDFYRDGCSIRLLNPQTFMPSLHQLNAKLQEYFHCMVGANIYLTPPNSQGFAPHYDDIEAFVLQIEGKKKWRLYQPRTTDEALPRESSGNLSEEDIGECVLEKTLEAGDLLYFPRGTIHQAKTVPGFHSLHITLSVYQKTSYGDLLEELTKQALNSAIGSEIDMRRGLPTDIWRHLGLAYADLDRSQRRREIITHIKELFSKIVDHADFDNAVDKMALKYQHDALPPVLSSHEINQTAFGTASTVNANGEICAVDMDKNTEVRLLRAHIMRLTAIEDVHRLYYYVDNSKEYHEYDMNFVEVDSEAVNMVQYLIKAYPGYSKIEDLPMATEDALDIVRSLWGRGLLMTRVPLN